MARILFIDDDVETLIMLSQMVSIKGHAALTSETGQEGLRQAEIEEPDLIILDMNLPDMTGTTLIQKLRAQPATADTPILMLSGTPTYNIKNKVKSAGGQAFLPKPIRLKYLLEVIREYTK